MLSIFDTRALRVLRATCLTTLLGFFVASCADDLPPAPDSNAPAQNDLYFTVYHTRDSSSVVSTRSDGTGRTVLAEGTIQTTPRAGRILWVEEDSLVDILWCRQPNGEVRAITARTTDPTREEILEPFTTALSPTGNRIVYGTLTYRATGLDGPIHFLHSVEPNGSNDLVIAEDVARNTHVSISPDGQHIAYYRMSPEKDYDHGALAVSSIYGGPVQVITDSAAPSFDGGSWLEWSPDGSRIAYVGWANGIQNIMVVNADGTGAFNVSKDLYRTRWPVWSPDGSKIAWMGGLDSDIYLADADGSNVANLTAAFGEGWSMFPQWSSDGRRLAYTLFQGDPEKTAGKIKVIDVATRSSLIVASDAKQAFWRR